MKRLALLGLLLLGINSSGFAARNPEKPNVILILLDDMGYGDLGVTGALEYKTPSLDRLAHDGILFTNYLSPQAVCSASRAGLLSGCYPNRLGISGALGPHAKTGIPANTVLLPELLKANGYTTGMVGKWHLGDSLPYLPLQNGFDDYLGLPYSNDMWPMDYAGKPATDHRKQWYPPLCMIDGNSKGDTIATLDDQARLTTRYTERALQFIREHADNPFFLYFAHSMPHVPINASSRFKGKSEQGLYGDVMMEIDWSVEQLLQQLRALKLENNTLIIFTSDNGPWINFGNHAGSTSGFREGKGTTFEGGQRVPCIFYWKGHLTGGRVVQQLASGLDIYPTIAKLCGINTLPEIDGRDFSGVLKGETDAWPREEFYYYYRKNNLEAVRWHNWKLVLPHPGRTYENYLPGKDGFAGPSTEDRQFPMALYDLRRDPGERYDVQTTRPEIVQRLLELADKARKDLGDDLTQSK